MNYFPFHIGDYAVHTRHLTLMEDLAYRRCIDLYYTRECALPADPAQVARLIAMRDHVEDVASVLREFFVQEELGDWVHLRCEAEIKKAQEAAERARNNGRAGGRPPKQKVEPEGNPEITQSVSVGNPDESKSKAPITQDQDQKRKDNAGAKAPSGYEPDGFKAFWVAWPSGGRKGGKSKCLELWKRKRFEVEATTILMHVAALKESQGWLKDGGQYVPAPISYLNNRSWDGADLCEQSARSFAGAI